VWVQPPSAVAFRFAPAGSSSLPLVAVSYHLNYASASNRMAEVEWLTNFADKKWRMPDGDMVTLPALLGGDNNSYPAPGVEGDVPLPELDKIADRPHRLHRSHVGTAGRRRMDTRPDEALRLAGLEDVARYWASTRDGDRAAALSRTVNACATHGPDARIDRAYATPTLLPAVTGVDVIEVDEQLSDHHIVRIKIDRDVLADILNGQTDAAAA
jgi:endonuclease/exonuclease/phosphatase family metal-dependent hydrolase